MADSKDGASFFRKVVRFVANPATDWNDINAVRTDDGLDLERTELKAMIERKRRNDFVRKREFDTLRRLRREGLSPEQLAALGGSSKVDDSEVRMPESGARADVGVKAKIDEIEQQMVGNGGSGLPSSSAAAQRRPGADARSVRSGPVSRPAEFYGAPTQPATLHMGIGQPAVGTPSPMARSVGEDSGPDMLPALPPLPAISELDDLGALPPLTLSPPAAPERQRPAPPAGTERPTASASARQAAAAPAVDLALEPTPSRLAVEVSEVVHDPELDEAVISFANADMVTSEAALERLCRSDGPRHHHAETWLVLFDLYRATGQQAKFESLAMLYAGQFGRSAPQWFSLPKLVADAAAAERPDTRGVKGEVGWISPERLDAEAVLRLRSATQQLPLPWVLDWGPLQQVDVDAADQLAGLMRQWAPQRIDMRWLGAEQLLGALQQAAPTGVRDADPAFWMARLEALRLANRPDQFDEAAIDYCVTYEVSPPSWEPAQCQVRPSSSGLSTLGPPSSMSTEVPSSLFESGVGDDGGAHRLTVVELSGQLAGDIGPVLAQLDRRLGSAGMVQVSCARLIRVDFIAAGDLLNWVVAKNNEHRTVTFADAHRLVAMFFGAMGINEHARVQVPRL